LFSFALALGFCSLCLTMSGCAGNKITVTNLPPNVTQQQVQDWVSAANDLKQAQQLTHSLQGTVLALRPLTDADGKPVLPTEVYARAVRFCALLSAAEIRFGQFLQTVPAKDFSASTKAAALNFTNDILGLIQQLNSSGITYIKNPGTLATINNFIAEIRAIITVIQNFTTAALRQTIPLWGGGEIADVHP
jgi:hypothetical protein